MTNRVALRVLFCTTFACLGWPVAAQVITSLPFGQTNNMVTSLPFGQKSVSPLRPVGKAKFAASAIAGGTVVAQWNMDETSGTVMNDSSGNGNNGKLTNVQTTGAGYIFDGLSSKVVVPNSASLTPGTRDFSYTVQIQATRIPPQGTDYDLIRKGTGTETGGEYKLEIVFDRGVGKPKCVVSDALGNTASERQNRNVVDGQVHTITCTKTSAGIAVQVDSFAPTASSGNVSGPISNTKPLTLGVKAPTAKGVGADWYFGTIINASVSVVP